MMNQQNQNFVKGNSGGNAGYAALIQYQQQQSQQHQNHALAMHLRAQSNFNRNQQSSLQQQTGQLVNANGLQGIAPAQISQLQAIRNQLNSNLSAQQNPQVSTNVNQQRYQQQSIQPPSNMQQSFQPPSNTNHQQQTQQATNPGGTGVINALFTQLQSIHQKMESLSSENGKNQIADAANQQPHRSSPPTTANNAISNNAQISMPPNTTGQPSQRPVPANAIDHSSANQPLRGKTMLQLSSQQAVPANTTVRPSTETTTGQTSQRQEPANTIDQPLTNQPLRGKTIVQVSSQQGVASKTMFQPPTQHPVPINRTDWQSQRPMPANTTQQHLRGKTMVQLSSQQGVAAKELSQPSSQQPVDVNATGEPSERPAAANAVVQPSSQQGVNTKTIVQPSSQQTVPAASTKGQPSQYPARANTVVQPSSQRPVPPNTMGQPSQYPARANTVVQPSSQQGVNTKTIVQPSSQRPVPPNTMGQPSQHPARANTVVQPSSKQPVPLNAPGQPSQRAVPAQTSAQPSQRQTSYVPTNVNTSHLSADGIQQRHHQRQLGTVSPPNLAQPKPTQQVHQSNPPGYPTATTTVNRAQNPMPNTNGQARAAAKSKQQPANTANRGGVVHQVVRQPSNPRPIATAQHQGRQKAATNSLAPTQPTASKNRQDPKVITSIRILSYTIDTIVRHIPRELHAAYLQLHVTQRFALENTIVFKFENRAKHDWETGENSIQVEFFMEKLKIHAPFMVENKLKLIGLKCKLCNNTDGYVNGSTSFIDVLNPRTLNLFCQVVQARTNHLIQCPHCNQINKDILAAYVPSAQDIQNLVSFCEKWLMVVRASYFTNVPRNALGAQPKEQTQVAEILPITEDSIYEDLVSSMEMGKAMGDLRLDDLTDAVGKLLSPVMEVLLMNFRLQSNGQTGIELCWKHSNAENTGNLLVWSFEKPFSVDDVFCKRIWDFFQQQCNASCELPKGIRKLVSSVTEVPTAELKFVGKNWSTYASRIFANEKVIKPKEDVKLLRPVYIPTPFEYLPATKSGTFPLQGDAFDDNDVVMISAYRDFIGNRRFRQTVSKFRNLYLKLPSNKQVLVVEQTISLIKRRGGSFYSKNGFLAQFDESFSFTSRAFQHGFPEMMHPVVRPDAKSVVSDVEFTRMVDILPDREESMKRAKKMMIESLSKSKTASPKSNENLTRKPPTSRQGQSPATYPGSNGTGKSLLREGQPVDISTLNKSSRLDTKESGKRKQDRSSVNKVTKRHRK